MILGTCSTLSRRARQWCTSLPLRAPAKSTTSSKPTSLESVPSSVTSPGQSPALSAAVCMTPGAPSRLLSAQACTENAAAVVHRSVPASAVSVSDCLPAVLLHRTAASILMHPHMAHSPCSLAVPHVGFGESSRCCDAFISSQVCHVIHPTHYMQQHRVRKPACGHSQQHRLRRQLGAFGMADW